MKYRILTYQELQILQEDFSEFLYKRGLNKFEWNVLQDQESNNAFRILSSFSDETFEKVLKDIKFLEFRSKNRIQSIKCQAKKMVILKLTSKLNQAIDFTDRNCIRSLEKESLVPYSCSKEVKYYEQEREKEIFSLIESGCYSVNSSLFISLNTSRKAIQN